ncbi:hypothetical protein [Thalassotalea castellviae]|uniref:Outer membrane protein beta-barrel domain-containing protein n=1 Tax=Thalassotalea castellviae TaxID=3075612 RepID=A0ABU3A523_9GAMM|nr:hypothetical protein [Thalassotalea sp. W431]MDT0605271.1 hypothetical protein [Thalassotalea sp. W431]
MTLKKQCLIVKPLQVLTLSTLMALPSQAIETNFSLHQGSESNTQGISLTISDSISRGSNFYWNVGYSYLDDVKVEWNQSDLFFKVDTVDAIISYRYKPRSYNQTMKNFTFEYQFGATMALTENKFVWPELNEEKYFSETNDINAMLGFNVHYDMSKNTSVNVGFRYHPSFSEFEDITSLYFGFTYKFGNQFGY